jgi:uncharacterized repeat protein (TIGR01451 family)
MKKLSMIAVSGITSVALAASIVSPAFAWHPKGQIVKSVQNVTAGGVLNDANTASVAVAAKPGDTLKYVIVISNTGDVDSTGNNDMAKTVMTDTLPAGVELTSNAAQRTITENIGTIKPGKSVTKEYTVKVTATKDSVIENKACFTGNSTANDNPQSGCDVADVKVTVPTVVVTPPAPVTPTAPAPVTPVAAVTPAPTVLPNTGPASIFMIGAAATVMGYALNVLRLKFRANQ